jgi:predicted metal-dependent hydrolase
MNEEQKGSLARCSWAGIANRGISMKYLTGHDFDLFCQGINQFNERKFFDCHETLEKLWHKQTGEEKELLQGLIQVAVAYHHWLAGNNRGALKLLKRGLMRVEVYEPMFLGLELTEFCCLIRTNIEQLENTLTCDSQPIGIAVLPTPAAGVPKA